MWSRLPPPQPDCDYKDDDSRRNRTSNLAGAHQVPLCEIPVVARTERQKRNQSEPNGGRAGDGEHHFEGGQPHSSGEGGDDGAYSREKAAYEQSRKPILLVQRSDSVLGVWTGVPLDPPQKRFRAEASPQRVRHAGTRDVADPAKQENR